MSSSTAEDWDRLQQIFAQALQHAGDSRLQFLDGECGAHPALRRQVEELLNAYDEADDVLEPSGDNASHRQRLLDWATPNVPDRISHYRVVRLIDSGGMGSVYEAEQDEPRRRVALKLMRRGLASKSALRRFQYESQLLGRLQHPNIAQIYEAGAHQDGNNPVPFYAMEFVPEARPITEYARESDCDVRSRLELFATICEAVGYAHQKGVIHRDLKPGNIVVGSDGRVKVIDFGVARATDAALERATRHTRTGDLVGTLQYMSPEQTLGDRQHIDTRSDVYSLGVVLYELLSNKLPYDVSALDVVKAARVIQEGSAARLGAEDSRLRGELETMVVKAMDKDPERRYGSAAEFGDDIQRYLNGDAILARPPTLGYQLRVFARKKKATFVAVIAVLLAAILGTIVSTALYFRSEQALVRVDTEREQAQIVADFLMETFKSVDPTLVGDSVSVRGMLDDAVQRIDDGILTKQPLVEATLRETIGEAYGDLSLLDPAVKQLEIALDIRQRLMGNDHPKTLSTANLLVVEYRAGGDSQKALSLAQKVFDARRRLLGDKHHDTIESMRRLADCFIRLGKISEGEELYRKVVQLCNTTFGPNSQEATKAWQSLGWTLKIKGDYVEAIKILRDVYQTRTRNLGDSHSSTLFAMDRLAFTLWEYAQQDVDSFPGELAEAEKLARHVTTVGEAHYGRSFTGTWESANYTLAVVQRARGKLDEAEAGFEELIEKAKIIRGPNNARLAGVLVELALVQRLKGDPEKALKTLQEALRMRRQINGNEHYYVGQTLHLIGQTLVMQDEFGEAETVLLESYNNLKHAFGAENKRTQRTVSELIRLYDLQGDSEQRNHWRTVLEGSGLASGGL